MASAGCSPVHCRRRGGRRRHVAGRGRRRAPTVGIVCTTVGRHGSPTFDLTTEAGYINLPDGNTAFMWGYSSGFDQFQHPGPVLCVNEGDTVTVDPAQHAAADDGVDRRSPARTDVLADGAPAQPAVSNGDRRR